MIPHWRRTMHGTRARVGLTLILATMAGYVIALVYAGMVVSQLLDVDWPL